MGAAVLTLYTDIYWKELRLWTQDLLTPENYHLQAVHFRKLLSMFKMQLPASFEKSSSW